MKTYYALLEKLSNFGLTSTSENSKELVATYTVLSLEFGDECAFDLMSTAHDLAIVLGDTDILSIVHNACAMAQLARDAEFRRLRKIFRNDKLDFLRGITVRNTPVYKQMREPSKSKAKIQKGNDFLRSKGYFGGE